MELHWICQGSAGRVNPHPSRNPFQTTHSTPDKEIHHATVKSGPLLQEVHGKIGDLVFRRGPDGQTIVSRAPQKKKKKSQKAQKAEKARNARQRQLMYEAHGYGRAAMANPETREHYEREAARWVRLPGGYLYYDLNDWWMDYDSSGRIPRSFGMNS